MTNESALKRCEIENTALNTRVTNACTGNLLDKLLDNFYGI
jgi:hypothetical protein